MIALIGRKIGMTQIFDDQAELIPTTVIHVRPNYVLAVQEAPGANPTVRLASNPVTKKHLTKAQQGEYTAAGIPLQRDIMEVRDFDPPCKAGDTLTVAVLKDTGYVDAIGWSKGRGYQGVVRRYGVGGGRKTHGSKFHREIGSTGMAAYPSKTLKNTKMAGRMPVKRVMAQNLSLVRIDDEHNTVMVRGAVPGPVGGKVIVRAALKRAGSVRHGNED